MKNTLIEWAHHTVNFWWGCTFARLADGSVRQECVNCYALLLSKLFSRGKATWGAKGKRMVRHEAALRELFKLDASAQKRGVRERVFINSMSDTFEDRRDLDEARAVLWHGASFVKNLDLLLLTKRPENVTRMVPKDWLTDWPAHVWMGTTAGTQAAADEAVPALLKAPAKVRFLSMEPLLEAVKLVKVSEERSGCGPTTYSKVDWLTGFVGSGDHKVGYTGQWVGYIGPKIHWVILGGESGPKARPMHPDWARDLRDQCKAAGVPFFFKQWGEWTPGENLDRGGRLTCAWFGGGEWDIGTQTDKQSENCHSDDSPDVYRVGKKEAGRRLDGVKHNEFPQP